MSDLASMQMCSSNAAVVESSGAKTVWASGAAFAVVRGGVRIPHPRGAVLVPHLSLGSIHASG